MIYEPAEDTYLMKEVLKKNFSLKDKKVLEIGFGSGYILEFLKDNRFKNLIGVDINPEAVNAGKNKNLSVFESDLFSNIEGKFDCIIFNPPYLPEDQLEDEESSVATTGGKIGSEITNRFLKNAKSHLTSNGKIFLLISNLTKGINWNNYDKKLIAEKKLFFEKLEVWELTI